MSKALLLIRRQAFEAQGGRCFYCNVLMWTEDSLSFARRFGLSERIAAKLQCTAEHLLPRQDGGGNSPTNVVAACRWCNHLRHAHRLVAPTPEAFAARVRRRVSKRRWHVSAIHGCGVLN
jgi:5-methylcytosine-specific restriction endonuclease McrA